MGDINWVPAPYNSRSATHRSKFDIGRADAGVGGMSISSGSGGASGMGASSSSSDSSAVAQSTESLGVGSGSICLAKNAPVACSSLGFFNSLAEFGIALCAQLTPSRCSRPCSRRRGPSLREPPSRPKTGAAMPRSWPSLRTSRRGRSGQEWRSAASGCSS